MKLSKYILGIGLLMTALFTSCDTDNVTDIYQNDTLGATFTFEVQEVNFPAYDYEGFDVEIVRSGRISEAVELPIKVSLLDAKGNATPLPAEIKAPSTASFAAGSFKTMVHVKVGDITSGKVYRVAVDIDEKETSIDGVTRKVAMVYRDYTYSKMGVGKLVSAMFGAEAPVEFYRADDIHWYKAIAPYEEGYDIVFKIVGNNQVLVEKQAIASDVSGYGTTYVEGMGELKDGVMYMNLEFTVSAGSFGVAPEVFVLPAE